MSKRFGLGVFAVLVAVFALAFLASMPTTEPVSGQTVPDCGTAPCTATPTSTPTPTQTPTATPANFTFYIDYVYATGQIRVYFGTLTLCLDTSKYAIDLDYGDGRTATVTPLPAPTCTAGGSTYYWTPPAPNFGPGTYLLVATLRELSPARVLRQHGFSVTISGPTATPTRTNTPFVVNSRNYLPKIQR